MDAIQTLARKEQPLITFVSEKVWSWKTLNAWFMENSDTDSIYRFTNKVEGRSVAICEGNPQLARGRTKEQVVRILTPCTCQQCQNCDHNFSFKDPWTLNNRRTVPINPMLCHNIKFKITTTWRGLLWDHIGCTMYLSDFAFSWDITKTFTDFHLRPSAPSWAALCEVRQILGFSPTGPPDVDFCGCP